MHEPWVLVVGQRPDPHIDAVAQSLNDHGGRCFILDRASNQTCSLEIRPEGVEGRLAGDGLRIGLAEVGAVWWRVKPSVPAEFNGGQDTVGAKLRWAEWKAWLRALRFYLPDAVWINDPARHGEISNKAFQLRLARDVGLRVPHTVVGNDVDEIVRLFESHEKVLYKTLSSFIIPPNEIIFSNLVDRDLIEQSRDSIALAPGIFQEYVDKREELRVTVVDDGLFVARIDSQSLPANVVDWRRDQWQDIYAPGALDEETTSRLMDFHRRAGLRYAAYDLIVTPAGEIVFLECNPGGQWLWLEHRLGLGITRALSDALLGGVSG